MIYLLEDVSNKTETVHFNWLNMTIGIKESKTWAKHLLCIFLAMSVVLWYISMLIQIHILILNLKTMKKILNLKLAIM